LQAHQNSCELDGSQGQGQALAALVFEAGYGAIGGLGKRHPLQIDTFGCRQIA
jgi:hypothetical protein